MEKTTLAKDIKTLKAGATIGLFLSIAMFTAPFNIALHLIDNEIIRILLFITIGTIGGFVAIMVKNVYDEKLNKLCEDEARRMYVDKLLSKNKGENK